MKRKVHNSIYGIISFIYEMEKYICYKKNIGKMSKKLIKIVNYRDQGGVN